jgi:hypothetical protein
LTDLYNSCDGIHWKCKDNWCTSSSAASNGLGSQKVGGGLNSAQQGRSTTTRNNLMANNITVMRPALTNLANWYGVKLDSAGFIISITLRSNRLRGTLPASLGLLTKLEYLDLHNNRLMGEVPSTIATCVSLRDLFLTDNRDLVVPSRTELQSFIPKCKLRL